MLSSRRPVAAPLAARPLMAALLMLWLAACGTTMAPVADPDLTPLPVVVVHSEPGSEFLGDRLRGSSYVWAPMPGIGAPETVLADTIEVWLAADLAALNVAELSRTEDWVAGTAHPGSQRIALRVVPRSTNPGLMGTMRHEVAHLAIHQATGGRVPVWLSEGYAQLASGQWDVTQAWRLRLAILRKGESPLREEGLRFRGRGVDARLGYLLSYTAVDQLYALGGDAGLAGLFRSLKDGQRFDQALRSVYGLTEAQFEQRWRKTVLDRYGWLYVFSRAALFWLVVSLLLFLLVGRRARTDRERLAEMRAEERLEPPEEPFVDEWSQ
ncbi:MAG: peptidase MA family metallohydrolase [Gemmatimonadota bacterium]